MTKKDTCPNCGESLVGGLIYDTMLKNHEGDAVKALYDAALYGATMTEGRWGLAIGMYDMDKDMTVAYQCPHCHAQWDRFTGEVTVPNGA